MQDITLFISHHLELAYGFAILLVLLVIIEFFRLRRLNFRVAPAQAVQLINRDNAVVIDLRANETYRQGHIIDALCLTARELADNPKKIDKYRNKPIILVCATGVESQKTALILSKQGYQVYALTGGIRGWAGADLPLVKN